MPREKARAAGKLEHRGLLYGMYVRESARGAGLADRLVEVILEHARLKVRTLLLTVVDDNARARGLYERHGFVAYGLETRAVREGAAYLDEVLMLKHLDG